MNRTDLARQALRAAIELRQKIGISERDPLCIYDAAEKLGVEVRFCLGDSFGGLFSKTSMTILVPTSRPRGRQAFTCAHELGHWYFDHGSRLERLLDQSHPSEDPEEYLVDVFAGYFLMPPWAVRNIFARRNINPKTISPLQLYAVASQFGVGYQTLIDHLAYSLRILPISRRKDLLKVGPKDIRQQVLGKFAPECKHASLVDVSWERVPVDLQVGDVAVLPPGTIIEGRSIKTIGDTSFGQLVQGIRPGVGRADMKAASWATFLRVSRADFVGRAAYRHLEDPDVN